MTAQREAQAALRATSIDALLDSIIQLTHRLHETDQRARSRDDRMAGAATGASLSLRAQRDLVRAEILRRTGDA